MTINDVKDKFISYFSDLGYKKLPASSIIPQNDPSVLFTTAGMQQFKPYYTDPTLAKFDKATTIQPVIRTSDIDEVGDDTHLTSFEMLGNFVFNQDDIFKLKEQSIKEAWQLITETFSVSADRITATIFAGEGEIPEDADSLKIWQSMGLSAEKIKKCAKADNFWGPTGDSGPCGPTTEIYVDGVEVWNLVFNEYFQDVDGKLSSLDKVGLDTGSGLERLTATLENKQSVWLIEPYITYTNYFKNIEPKRARIVADHIKTACILIDADITPGKNGREAVLRRLLRRAIFLSNDADFSKLVEQIATYRGFDGVRIMGVINQERESFVKVVDNAKSDLNKWLTNNPNPSTKDITEMSFMLFQSRGFPQELAIEYLSEKGIDLDKTHFLNLFSKHQEVSRQGSDKQFKGGLVDNDPQTIKHHTAHHLLLAALRKILGDNIIQKGSNVTSERLRIDFNYDQKVPAEKLTEIEKLVNSWIEKSLPVNMEEMDKNLALKTGALAEFGQKYGDRVKVYTIKDGDDVISIELCGGPHIKNTSELKHFTILKEEASSAGIRRIKAKVA